MDIMFVKSYYFTLKWTYKIYMSVLEKKIFTKSLYDLKINDYILKMGTWKKDLRHLSKLQFAVSSNSISLLDEFHLKREQCNMK